MAYSAMVRLVNPREHQQEEDEEAPCRVPLGRLGRPEDAADLAVLSAAVGWLTGQVIALDDGIPCHYL